LPHWPPERDHTRCNTFRASKEYFLERCRVAALRYGCAVWDNRLRALSLDHPVTSHTWSNKTDFSAFDAAL